MAPAIGAQVPDPGEFGTTIPGLNQIMMQPIRDPDVSLTEADDAQLRLPMQLPPRDMDVEAAKA
ncbi:MAG: hypothetical protein OEQ39_12700, partial [Gammaproteobacteria bacterium]|nr:hypothetical protein [Gammaproteobacteria bacterium]